MFIVLRSHSILTNRKTAVKRKRFPRTVLLLLLFLSLMFTDSQYVRCQILYPDEALDFFGIRRESGDSLTTLGYHPVVCPSGLFAATHPVRCRGSGDLYLQGFASELVLSVTLRC